MHTHNNYARVSMFNFELLQLYLVSTVDPFSIVAAAAAFVAVVFIIAFIRSIFLLFHPLFCSAIRHIFGVLFICNSAFWFGNLRLGGWLLVVVVVIDGRLAPIDRFKYHTYLPCAPINSAGIDLRSVANFLRPLFA